MAVLWWFCDGGEGMLNRAVGGERCREKPLWRSKFLPKKRWEERKSHKWHRERGPHALGGRQCHEEGPG